MTVIRPLRTRAFAVAESLWLSLPSVFSHGVTASLEAATYFLGQTDGVNSVALACVQVRYESTRGSFHVSAAEMRRVVETARTTDLQVVGQMHTHPRKAYHSDGDEEGAQIKHNGFVSIVAPDYGRFLPDFAGVCVYMYSTESESFIKLAPAAIRVVSAVQ